MRNVMLDGISIRRMFCNCTNCEVYFYFKTLVAQLTMNRLKLMLRLRRGKLSPLDGELKTRLSRNGRDKEETWMGDQWNAAPSSMFMRLSSLGCRRSRAKRGNRVAECCEQNKKRLKTISSLIEWTNSWNAKTNGKWVDRSLSASFRCDYLGNNEIFMTSNRLFDEAFWKTICSRNSRTFQRLFNFFLLALRCNYKVESSERLI